MISATMGGLPLSAPRDPWDCVLENERGANPAVSWDPKREEGEWGEWGRSSSWNSQVTDSLWSLGPLLGLPHFSFAGKWKRTGAEKLGLLIKSV